ncbi:MAG: hypothetical protein HY287_17250 [Planctomycetes bacterium]|nr:hypothetical protein [Planctomycetota bacterium]
MSNCPQDCGGGEVCGNGVCGNGENVSNCPEDCSTGEVCGNGVCGTGEDVTNCPQDCTGNCSSSAGVACSTDFEAQYSSQWQQHGAGACENTGGNPSFESLSVSIPSQVSPGQSVTMTVQWNRCIDCDTNAVIYTSFLGNWDPNNPLTERDNFLTTCDETSTDTVTFAAPTQQGSYRVRWIHCFASTAIHNFCGDGLPGNSSAPGVCPYVERTLTVCN